MKNLLCLITFLMAGCNQGTENLGDGSTDVTASFTEELSRKNFERMRVLPNGDVRVEQDDAKCLTYYFGKIKSVRYYAKDEVYQIKYVFDRAELQEEAIHRGDLTVCKGKNREFSFKHLPKEGSYADKKTNLVKEDFILIPW